MNDTTELQHNSAARAAHINSQFAELFAIDDDIETLRAKHITPLTQERTKVWRNLKKDTDITRKVLELHYKQYALARLAAEQEDGGDKILDDMKEVFQALHPGGQVDWVAIVRGDAGNVVDLAGDEAVA